MACLNCEVWKNVKFLQQFLNFILTVFTSFSLFISFIFSHISLSFSTFNFLLQMKENDTKFRGKECYIKNIFNCFSSGLSWKRRHFKIFNAFQCSVKKHTSSLFFNMTIVFLDLWTLQLWLKFCLFPDIHFPPEILKSSWYPEILLKSLLAFRWCVAGELVG